MTVTTKVLKESVRGACVTHGTKQSVSRMGTAPRNRMQLYESSGSQWSATGKCVTRYGLAVRLWS